MNYFTKLLKIHTSGLVKVNKCLLHTQNSKTILSKTLKFCGVSQFCSSKCYDNRRCFHTSNNLLANKDFYKTLGVSKNADKKDIKKAYIQLAKKYHPDKNKGDKTAAQKFTEVAEAYEVLGDQRKRQEYDMLGSAGYQANQQGGGGGGPQWGGFGGGQSVNPEDLFKKIFEQFEQGGQGMGGQRGGGNPFEDYQEYAPLEVHLDLTFNEAAKGVNKKIQIEMMDTCGRCGGSGAEPGTKVSVCGYCGGTGQEQIATGPFVMRSTCRKCGGSGKLITTPCQECRGKGQVKQKKNVTVPVPAGIEDKQTVRMQVGPREVFITFRVLPSKIFRRQGSDVHSDLEVSIFQAALGATVRIPGVHGDQELVVPAGTNSHQRFTFRNKGIKKMNSWGYGDHYVHVKVKSPRNMTPHHLQMLYGIAMNIGEKDIDSAKYYQEPPKTKPKEEPIIEPVAEEKQENLKKEEKDDDLKDFKDEEPKKEEEGFLNKEKSQKKENKTERKKSCG